MKNTLSNPVILVAAIALMIVGIWALSLLPKVNWHAIQSHDSAGDDAALHQYPRPITSILPKHPNDSWEDIKDKEK
ncbi:MAG: hypothetical protein QM796_08460 [Chthoniobacteraceae bacterium]